MQRFLKWGFLLALIGGSALTWTIGNAYTAPTNSPVAAFASPAREVRIASTPGIELAGTYWPSTDPSAGAILLLHGNNSSRADVKFYAEPLVAEGFTVLAIDFRGHGESTPAVKSFGWLEAEDAHAALAWLKARNPQAKLGAIGLSLGGAAAVLGPKGPLPVDALIMNSVYPDIRTAIHNRVAQQSASALAYIIEPLLSYQAIPRVGISPSEISPIRALGRVKSALMIVGGSEDRFTPPDETKALFNAAGSKAELLILEGLGHSQAIGMPSAEFRSKLISFFHRHLNKS